MNSELLNSEIKALKSPIKRWRAKRYAMTLEHLIQTYARFRSDPPLGQDIVTRINSEFKAAAAVLDSIGADKPKTADEMIARMQSRGKAAEKLGAILEGINPALVQNSTTILAALFDFDACSKKLAGRKIVFAADKEHIGRMLASAMEVLHSQCPAIAEEIALGLVNQQIMVKLMGTLASHKVTELQLDRPFVFGKAYRQQPGLSLSEP